MQLLSRASDQQGRLKSRFYLSRRVRDNLRAYLFVLPWLISLLAFTAYPMFASFYFAMTKYDVLNPPQWIGFDNFKVMFTTEPLFWKSVWNTTYFALVSVPVGLIVALALAILLNGRNRGIGIYRTAFYLPSLMPAVASTLVWMVLLNPRLGLVNMALEFIGLPQLGWLASATWAMPAVILMAIWSGSGQPMLIFLAGLKEIPVTLLEAATIDGANAWQRFWHVTLPLLTPTIFFNLVIGIIASFQVFTIAFIASNPAAGGSSAQGVGPLNSLLVYMIHLYRNGFRYFNMGYASAMALVMFVVLIIITLVVLRTSDAWVYYEGGGRR